jgi:hypothetical protein
VIWRLDIEMNHCIKLYCKEENLLKIPVKDREYSFKSEF